MHFRTHAKRRSLGQAGRWQSAYHDTMIDHDKHVGRVLDKLDKLGIAEDTIVVYSTDNGVHMNSWPDAGMTPFRSEKNTNWEGAFRVPSSSAGRGRSPPASSPTRSSAISTGCRRSWPPRASRTSRRSCSRGTRPGDKTFKVHLDGYNLLPYLTGEADESPRNEFFYFSDDGDLVAFRYDNWKLVFMEQRMPGTLAIWGEPFVATRIPVALQPADRPVRARRRHLEHLLGLVHRPRLPRCTPAQAIVGEFLSTFVDFPPRMKAASFTIDQVQEKLEAAISSGR